MLLVMDVGNTNITMGLYRESELLAKFRMTTKQPRTSDEYGIAIREMIRNQGENPEEVDDIIIASVVPDIMHSLGSCIIKYFNRKPIIVSAGIKTGIRVATENPRQTGPDKIVDAVAAYYLYGGPVIVIDFGTATTYDLVEPDGTFAVGVIAPGIRTSARALGEMQPCFRRLKYGNRILFWPERQCPVCRPDWCTAISVRQNILLTG